jgi:hypothetical protein
MAKSKTKTKASSWRSGQPRRAPSPRPVQAERPSRTPADEDTPPDARPGPIEATRPKVESSASIDPSVPVRQLLANIKAALPELEEMLQQYSSHWGYEDSIYRFYHQSYKVYRVQAATTTIVSKLETLAPGRPLNEWFMRIVAEGTGKEFAREHNKHWLEVTRPMVEAFFHARFMLELAVNYGRELEAPPRSMPSGWAALLYLYDLRYA